MGSLVRAPGEKEVAPEKLPRPMAPETKDSALPWPKTETMQAIVPDAPGKNEFVVMDSALQPLAASF